MFDSMAAEVWLENSWIFAMRVVKGVACYHGKNVGLGDSAWEISEVCSCIDKSVVCHVHQQVVVVEKIITYKLEIVHLQ